MYDGRFQIGAYMHCHKLYNHKKNVWSAAVPYKIYILQCDFMEMVRGIVSSKRKMFHEKPMTMFDNYFVTNAVIDWASNVGHRIIGTNVRNRLSKEIE